MPLKQLSAHHVKFFSSLLDRGPTAMATRLDSRSIRTDVVATGTRVAFANVVNTATVVVVGAAAAAVADTNSTPASTPTAAADATAAAELSDFHPVYEEKHLHKSSRR